MVETYFSYLSMYYVRVFIARDVTWGVCIIGQSLYDNNKFS